MSQKVWVLGDRRVNPSTSRVRFDDPPAFKGQVENLNIPEAPQKSPALSVSFAVMVWGGGHFYLREFHRGWLLLSAMGAFFTLVSCLVLFRQALSPLVAGGHLPASLLLFGLLGVLFQFLVLWAGSVFQAYGRTVGLRTKPFQGVDNELGPLFASLLFPGWGQYLNGQPKKGIFFFLSGLMGICSLTVLAVFRESWPLLVGGPDRTLVEVLLFAALGAIPLWLFLWLVSVHDAFWVCREPTRKRPILDRLSYMSYRVRTQGVVGGLFPEIRNTTLLVLLLAASVLAAMEYVPWDDFHNSLEWMRAEMVGRDMEILPEMIGRIIGLIGWK